MKCCVLVIPQINILVKNYNLHATIQLHWTLYKVKIFKIMILIFVGVRNQIFHYLNLKSENKNENPQTQKIIGRPTPFHKSQYETPPLMIIRTRVPDSQVISYDFTYDCKVIMFLSFSRCI